eukprot:scaffold15587_cov73-Phaeocystis_antarctica.AAC.2
MSLVNRLSEGSPCDTMKPIAAVCLVQGLRSRSFSSQNLCHKLAERVIVTGPQQIIWYFNASNNKAVAMSTPAITRQWRRPRYPWPPDQGSRTRSQNWARRVTGAARNNSLASHGGWKKNA